MKFALRSLAKSPGFSLVAIATLAIGIGANTAMFSVVNTLLFHPAPYPAADRLVRLHRTTSEAQNSPLSLPDLRDLAEQSRTFASLTAYCMWSFSLAEPGQPAETLPGAVASANLFHTLGVQPMLGRAFTAAEQQPGRDRVAVISHALWQNRFGGDPGILNRAVRMDGESVDIIGIMPASAEYPLYWGRVDVWRPLSFKDDWRQSRNVQWLNAIGRLHPRIAPAAAQSELATLADHLARQYPDTNAGAGLRLVPFEGSSLTDVGRNLTWLTLGLAGFVLLIACANLGNLQLARQAAHSHDLAIRVALGATRGRLVRQLLGQSLALAVAGGTVGLLVAWFITDYAAPQLLGPAAAGLPFRLDRRVVAFAGAATLLTGVLAGALPAWLASRAALAAAMREQSRSSTGGRTQHRARQALIVAQLAFSLVLLAGSGFFVQGLQRVMRQDPGWNSAPLLQGTITLPDNRYPDDPSRRVFHDRLLQELQRLPGVKHAALATALPLIDSNQPEAITLVGRAAPLPGQEPYAHQYRVSSGYFEAMGIALVEGRGFDANLRPDGPRQLLINETMARRFWPGESALGHRLQDPNWADAHGEIIGVVRDADIAGQFGAQNRPLQVYYPIVQHPWGYVTIVLHSSASASLIQPLRNLVARLDPDLPVTNLQPTTAIVAGARRHLDAANQLLAAFAAVGLALAAIGLYGVISGLVVQRRREFGIRLALGAEPRDILWEVLRAGSSLALAGTALGLLGATGVLRVLGQLIPGLAGGGHADLLAAMLILIIVALLASWLPARRASKVDPLIALRAE